jgi:predicted DNA-binding transcriptional regulator AlpA
MADVLTDRLITKREAQQRLGDVSRATLDRMINRGDLAIVRVSERAVRISEQEIRRLVEQRTERRGR